MQGLALQLYKNDDWQQRSNALKALLPEKEMPFTLTPPLCSNFHSNNSVDLNVVSYLTGDDDIMNPCSVEWIHSDIQWLK